MTRRYFWDFFGRDAEGTAQHFAHHLDEFVAARGLGGCTSGVVQPTPGEPHFAAFLVVPDAAQPAVEKGLRPRRAVEE